MFFNVIGNVACDYSKWYYIVHVTLKRRKTRTTSKTLVQQYSTKVNGELTSIKQKPKQSFFPRNLLWPRAGQALALRMQ